MKRLSLFIIAIIFAGISFSQIKVIPLSDKNYKANKNALFYYLPKTVIDIDITVETGEFTPGPYSKFAEKYLSIKNPNTKEMRYSKITNINLRKITVPDPECAYIIEGKKLKIQYEDNGIIKSFGTFDSKTKDKSTTIESLNIKENIDKNNSTFTDLSMYNNLAERVDTSYRIVERDSVLTKIPVYKSQITNKELEEKAKEVADLIIKIRQNKFNLMSGNFETEVPPSDISALILELEKLENKYLELFTGKTQKVRNIYNYKHSPKSSLRKETVPIFWLSDKNGVEFIEKHNNEPITFEITNNETNNEIKNFYKRQNKIDDKTKGLFYRIPDYGTIKISYMDYTYYEAKTIIPQFGIINYISNEVTNDKNTKIIFDTNSGFIEAISNE